MSASPDRPLSKAQLAAIAAFAGLALMLPQQIYTRFHMAGVFRNIELRTYREIRTLEQDGLGQSDRAVRLRRQAAWAHKRATIYGQGGFINELKDPNPYFAK